MYEITVNNYMDVEEPEKNYIVEANVKFTDESFKNRLNKLCNTYDMKIYHKRKLISYFKKEVPSVRVYITQNHTNNQEHICTAFRLKELIQEKTTYSFSSGRHAKDFSKSLEECLKRYLEIQLIQFNKLLDEASDY